MKKVFLLSIILFSSIIISNAQQKAKLFSPSGEIRVDVENCTGKLQYSVAFNDKIIMENMPLSMTFNNGTVAGEGIRTLKFKTELKEENFEPVIPVRSSKAKMVYNETEFRFKKYSVIFRIYDDAVSYRFITRFGNDPIKVTAENVAYNFVNDNRTLFPKERSMHTHQEQRFINTTLSGINDGDFCSHPLVVSDNNVRMLITEVDLESYPGIYYRKNDGNSFSGQFTYYPAKTKKTSDRNVRITEYTDYMAETAGNRSYPWRVVLINDNDAELLSSNTLYSLASPCRLEDPSWIKCGKVSWDWWNNKTLTGVDFESGVNNKTYKYYIDFASANGLQYIILDEGWYNIRKGVFDVVDEIDLEELVAYGKQKHVDIILWVTWLALEENMEAAFDKYSKMGIKGFKIDFMQRDDQWMVDWYYSTTMRAAEHHMIVDYHGAYKPTGLTRTFPNMLTSEGVFGAEQAKWRDDLTPTHNVTLPFTRMALGPMDYTPGAMNNSRKGEFIARNSTPMSQGTRCNQLAMYVIYESPLQMLSDSPTNYEKEPDMMKFLSEVPTTWDETLGLDASMGEYLIMARRKGNKWWLGGMTDWTPREKEVTLDFLQEGKEYKMTIWQDGVNVKKNAEDYRILTRNVKKGDRILFNLASGGGFVATIEAQ